MNEINVKKSRFRDADWFSSIENISTPIIVGGAGGIGTWVIMFLSRVLSSTKGHIVVYDFDTVEEVNMAGQMFSKSQIGLPKVSAISETVSQFSDISIVSTMNELYTQESFRSPIVFSCFDNMKARKDMFENWKKEMIEADDRAKRAIFIDGRLLAEQFQVFFVTPDKAKEYEEKYLFDDSEVEDANCSYKQTTHFAAAVAAKMIQGFTNWFSDAAVLPFYYEEVGTLFLTNQT